MNQADSDRLDWDEEPFRLLRQALRERAASKPGVEEHLSDETIERLVSGALPLDVVADRISDHLLGCPACVAKVNAAGRLRDRNRNE